MVFGILPVLALGAVAGWPITLFCLPRRFTVRWIVTAPIVGMATLTVAGLPLSMLGIPVKAFAPALVAILALIGAVATFHAWKRHPLLRADRLFGYLGARGGRLAVLGAIITGLSAYMMTSWERSNVRDVWGSTDYAAYWGVSDYLLHHGGGQKNYETQNEFRSGDVRDHLYLHARLGCMTYLAVVAAIFDPAHVHRWVTFTIVAAMCSMIGVVAIWVESVGCRTIWPLFIVACHPFLYFLLYFSYLSQASSLVMTLLGFLLAREALGDGKPFGRAVAAAAASGVLLGATLLHYPGIPPIIACFFAAVLLELGVVRTLRERWKPILCWMGVIVLCTFYYLPACLRELIWLSGPDAMRGWNWRRPIGVSEFAGVSTVLGYYLPPPLSLASWIREFALGAVLVAGGWCFWRRGRERAFVGALAVSTAVLGGIALWKVSQNLTNATHSYVKILSFFAPVLVVACLVPWARWIASLPAMRARLLIALGLLAWLPAEVHAVRRGRGQTPHFSEEFIDLARRQAETGAKLTAPPKLSDLMLAPIVRNVASLAALADASSRTVVIMRAREFSELPIVDRHGEYVARLLPAVPVTPPR